MYEIFCLRMKMYEIFCLWHEKSENNKSKPDLYGWYTPYSRNQNK